MSDLVRNPEDLFSHIVAQLTLSLQIFKRGQPYKIILDIDVPESPANKQLGLYAWSGSTVLIEGISGVYILK